jgi:hypothetical protein
MKRLKTSLNSNQNIQNKNSDNSSSLLNRLKKDDEKSLSLDESFSISVNTDEESSSKLSDNDSKSDVLSSDLEELQHRNKDEFLKDKENIKKSQQIIGKKRKNISLSAAKKVKNYSNLEKNNKCKNKKENKNGNTYTELKNCYNELEKIMSKYSFLDIAKIILKINNGIIDKSNENHELYKKLEIISSVINKKDNITLMCLSILYSKTHSKNSKKEEEERNKSKKNDSRKKEDKKEVKKEDKEDDNENKEEKVKRKHTRERFNGNKIINSDMSRIIKRIKKKEKEPYIFREHFYHVNKKIYCYKPKSSKSTYYQILYCEKRDIIGCNAKILVNSNPNDILVLGEHGHRGISLREFYKRFPMFKNKDWNHIQLVKEDDEEYIIYNN